MNVPRSESSDFALVGIAHAGLDGRWVWVNPRFAAILGYSPAELLQRSFQELAAPGDVSACAQDVAADDLSQHARRIRCIRKDGSEALVNLTSTLVRDPDGTPRHYLHIIEQISAPPRDEPHVEWLVQGAPDALLIVDGEGRIREMNAQATRLLGFDRESLIGLRLEVLVPARLRDRHRAHRDAYAIDPRPRVMGLGMDLLALRKDGTEIPVEITLNPLQTDEGLLTAASIRDVSQDQEHTLRRQRQKAQKMEAVALFVGGIAHDSNNQLTAILGYSEMLLSQIGPDKPSWADLEEIHKAAVRSAALTKQLLAFTRQQVLRVESVIANDVILETDKLLARLLGDRVRLDLRLAPGLRPIKIDVSQLEQIITNLAINARDAMPHGGTLTVETANIDVDDAYASGHVPMVPGPYVMLTVRDTGIGMDEQTKGRIFEPFFTTKGPQGGTGLGLPTVFGIVKQLNGFLWVDSAVGQGTTFTIHFPATEGPPDVRRTAEARSAAPVGTQTILVVDDEEGVRNFTLRALRRHGYHVLEAATPGEALALLDQPSEAIHLVVTDLVMPEMTGLELVARLGPNPGFRVLFTSGYADPKKLGGDFNETQDFLAKPFSVQQLLHKVHDLLTTTVS